MAGVILGSRAGKANIDGLTDALQTITYAHHEIHGGSSFSSRFTDSTMGDNETVILAFKTAAGIKRAHMLFSATSLVGGDMEVFEGAAWTNQSGTKAPIINRKRLASMKSSTLLEDQAQVGFVASNNIIANVTGLNTGSATSIDQVYLWGIRNKIGAGGARGVDEWILKPDTQYAVVFTAEGGSNKGEVFLNWYEHTDSS